jgi:3-dehydroquinate synthase
VSLDAKFFEFLAANSEAILRRDPAVVVEMIARCCRLKARIVEQDERELSGLRSSLNFGHTFAHAFESVSDYGNWLHGEAVSAGMVCAGRLADRRGLIAAELTGRLRSLLARFGLPVQPARWRIDDLLPAMRADKKNIDGKFRLVLPRALGQVSLFDDVSDAEIRHVLEELAAEPGQP